MDKLVNGKAYPQFMIAGAATGRFTCSNPNFQNLPRSGFKRLIVTPEGKSFVGGDLSQIELRVAGEVAGEPVIQQAYRDGVDLHRQMAAMLKGISGDEVSKEDRTLAKAVNFGLLFGAGATTLMDFAAGAYGVEMSLDEAQTFKRVFHQTYPDLTRWQREIVDTTNLYGFSESVHSGLRRYYDQEVYTHAMNFPIQSSAWEVLALAIIETDKRLTPGMAISHHVHDELVLLVDDDLIPEAVALLEEEMTNAFTRVFPDASTRDLIEIDHGKSWADL